MKLPHCAGIYAITCTATCELYIGSSKDIQRRWISHRSTLRLNKNKSRHLQMAWNKYGEDVFIVSVIEPVEYHSEADLPNLIQREQYYIDTLNPQLNIRTIAESNVGLKKSAEVSANLSRKLKGRVFSDQTIQRMRDARANTSDITRQRMSQAKKGIVPTIATEAAAKANKGKSRPQSVIDKISETRRLTAQRQKAEGYSPKRDEKGKFIGGS